MKTSAAGEASSGDAARGPFYLGWCLGCRDLLAGGTLGMRPSLEWGLLFLEKVRKQVCSVRTERTSYTLCDMSLDTPCHMGC